MLKIKAINKSYGEHCVLRNTEMQIDSETKVLLGINGCGKSTLLKIVAGIIDADSGHIYLDEKDIIKLPPEKRLVGYVPQKAALFPHLSVKQNILYGIRGKAPEPELLDRIIDMLGIKDILHRKPNELSGGYKSRVSFARALIPQPKILLLDEPLSDVDAVLKETLLPEFRKVISFLKIPAMYVTHDPAEAEIVGNSFAVMKNGSIQDVCSAQKAFELIR